MATPYDQARKTLARQGVLLGAFKRAKPCKYHRKNNRRVKHLLARARRILDRVLTAD